MICRLPIAVLAALSALAQPPATPRPQFEIADIHPSGLAINPYTFLSGGVLRGERYDLRKVTVLDMIRFAWDVSPDTIVGGPNWLEFDRFDIAAKAPAGTPPATVRLMLQSLLTDRFKLEIHRDTRPMPAFELAAGKSAHKLQPARGADDPACTWIRQPNSSTFTVYSCRNITMKAFAPQLHSMAGDYLLEPVVDNTNLDGSWDFDIRWNGRSRILPPGTERITVFDAVEKQLGLALSLKRAPAPVLVIDRVNEKPTPNPPDVAKKLPPREVEFEVADLKPAKPGEPGGGLQVTRGGGLQARAMDMRILLATAWDVDWDHLERFVGLPKWVESARFTINAKASTSTNSPPVMGTGFIDDDVRLMLRALLIDRFKIKWHFEDRPVDAWTLSAAQPKLKKADPTNRASCKESRNLPNDPRDTNPLLAELISCQNVTMAEFAARLQPVLPDDFAYPAEDATGLSGRWDFTLNFTPAWMLNQAAQNAGALSAAEPNGAISLPEAMTKQLGLKLEKRKRMLPVVVIDHIEEKPAEN